MNEPELTLDNEPLGPGLNYWIRDIGYETDEVSFDTAQEAFDFLEQLYPGTIVQVNIDPHRNLT